MDLKRRISDERVQQMQEKYSHATVKVPRCNPWQYSNRGSSYPKDQNHPDYAGPNGSGLTRLYEAVVNNDLARVKQLIDEEGASPFTMGEPVSIPYALARNMGYWDIAAFLVARQEAYAEECERYERLTGKKLGLRSLRRARVKRAKASRIESVV